MSNRCQIESQIDCQNKYAIYTNILPDGMSETMSEFQGGDHSKNVFPNFYLETLRGGGCYSSEVNISEKYK